MRMERNKLTAAKISRHCAPGYLIDGGGLYLQIARRAAGKSEEDRRTAVEMVTKSWSFRYRNRTNGRLTELGLGSLVDVSLAEARTRASELRGLLREGKDPKTELATKRAALKVATAKGMTFDEAAAACIADRRAGWKNEKHADQWVNTLATYCSPIIGSLPISSIDLALVRKVLDPIWTTKNETASRVRQRLEAVIAWATVSGYREGDNPARWRGFLDQLLPKPSKVQKREHHSALPYLRMAEFIGELRGHHGMAPLALKFAILTAARTGEVIAARWEEFDMEKRLWVIPSGRMKAGKEHVVPLSAPAWQAIYDLEQTKEGSYVFSGGKEGTHLSNMAMNALLRRMPFTDITVHGFRSSFRDWAGEQTHFPREVIEHALAHQLKDKAEAAYSRSTMPEKRRQLMEDWATFCCEQPQQAIKKP